MSRGGGGEGKDRGAPERESGVVEVTVVCKEGVGGCNGTGNGRSRQGHLAESSSQREHPWKGNSG